MRCGGKRKRRGRQEEEWTKILCAPAGRCWGWLNKSVEEEEELESQDGLQALVS